MNLKIMILICDACHRKEDTGKRLFYLTKLTVFLFCCFSISANSQSLTLETIQQFKNNCRETVPIQPQSIPNNSKFIRFPELGKIYNPNFPTTKNRVLCENYILKNSDLLYIGKSISTFRATVNMNGETGKFYARWTGAERSSLLEFQTKENSNSLEVTGTIYKM